MALKTRRTKASVAAFLEAVPDDRKREDSLVLVAMMQRATGHSPAMWGTSLVGFGEYSYTNSSGREAGWFLTGFSPRKAALTIYIMPGFSGSESLLEGLGRHKVGKSCLYVKRLADIDLSALDLLISTSVETMRTRYGEKNPRRRAPRIESISKDSEDR